MQGRVSNLRGMMFFLQICCCIYSRSGSVSVGSAALLEVSPEVWVLRGSGILMRPEILLELVDLVP